MSTDIIKKQIEAYRPNFLAYGDTPKGTFQNDRETQYLRFSRLINHLLAHEPKENNNSIHDVGAGMCDLHVYLAEAGIVHEYSGTEIVEEMVQAARLKYPEIKIANTDLLAGKSKDQYDFTVLSGTFNIPGSVPPDEWKSFTLKMIERMFELSRKGIAFNFLTTASTFNDPKLYYFDPAELLGHCIKKLSRFTIADHGYPLYESTITVWKKSYMNAIYPSAALAKYFKN